MAGRYRAVQANDKGRVYVGGQEDGFGPSQRGGRGRDRPQPARRPGHHSEPEGRHDYRPEGPHDYGPVQRGGPSSRLGGLVTGLSGRRVVKVGLLLVAAAGVYGLMLAGYASLSMDRSEVSGLSRAGLRLNVLVVGNDSREGLTPEELEALGTEQVSGNRPDTVLLLALRGGRAAMLSFPRDLLVTQCDGQRGRLNSAYAAGGPSCLVQTVTETSGIPITHYVEVNFLGFIDLVDALGGVELFLDEPITDQAAGVDLPAGCVELDGQEAIGFVRARHGSSDLDRVARQQRFLGEIADELMAPTTLLNPVRLFRVAGASGRAVTADEGLGTFDLLRIARGARGFAGGGMATHTVPASPSRVGGASVLVPDEAAAGDLYTRFRDGAVLAGEPDPEAGQPGEAPADGATGESAEPSSGDEPAPEGPAPAPEDC